MSIEGKRGPSSVRELPEYRPKELSEEEKREILEELKEAVGSEWAKDDPAFLAPWSRDCMSRVDEPDYMPQFIVSPSSTEEVSAVMKIARKHGLEVVVPGSGASTFGIIPTHHGGIVIELKRMDEIEIDEESMTATVGAGVTLSNLLAEGSKRRLKNDVPGAPTTTYVIGNFSMMGGEHFGNTHYGFGQTKILGSEIVLATGEISRSGRLAFPDSEPGYFGPDMDFSTLAAASDGLAGVFTKVTLKLFPLGSEENYAKYVSLAFFTEGLTPAMDAMKEIVLKELSGACGECGPRYAAGVFPTPNLEEHYKLQQYFVAADWKTMVWADTRGTKEQVEYQKKRTMEIFEKHGGLIDLQPLLEMLFVDPYPVEPVVERFESILGIELCPEWIPRLSHMFDISETPCRGFGVRSHILVGAISSGVKWAKMAGVKFHEIMKEMNYPSYEDFEWASYGTHVRGGSAKAQELDVGFDRKVIESCDWRDKYLEEYIKGMREAGVPPYLPPLSGFAYLTAVMKTLLQTEPLEVVMGPKGAEINQAVRDITDPDRIMHRHRDLDETETKL